MNRRRLIFAAITFSVALGASLVVAEIVLRLHSGTIRSSESMDPGLIGYDSRLGWKLQPGWAGTHRHHDFEVRYEIGEHGFRGRWPDQASPPSALLVGDSFTFGLGVGDEQTFSALLDDALRDVPLPVVNLSVPGYSTDQETLLLEETIGELPAARVYLIVCLINDVFDNERTFPLQAAHGKPRFVFGDDGQIRLDNVPVPSTDKPREAMRENLATLVKGDLEPDQTGITRWLGGKEICRRLGLFQPTFEPPDGFFEERFADGLELMDALIARARVSADSAGASFELVLMPGRSLVEAPPSYSARYQSFLAEQIESRASTAGIPVHDLTPDLAARWKRDATPLFHPNEGHLSVAGHAAVASILEKTIRASLAAE